MPGLLFICIWLLLVGGALFIYRQINRNHGGNSVNPCIQVPKERYIW